MKRPHQVKKGRMKNNPIPSSRTLHMTKQKFRAGPLKYKRKRG
jgi:hypothetical protein